MADKITLVYPPATLPTSPYSSLPYLQGGLEYRGWSVECIDINAEAYDFWLSDKYDEDLYRSCDIGWAKSFFKSSETELIDKDKYTIAKRKLDSFFDRINGRLKGSTLTLGGYINSGIALSSCGIRKIAENRADPLSCFYRYFFSAHHFTGSVIGISVTYDFQLLPSLVLAYFIKKSHTDVRIILGGASIRYVKSFFLVNAWIFDWVDIVIVGDGVAGISEYMEGRIPSGSLYLNDSVVEECNDNFTLCPYPHIPDYSGIQVDKYLSPKPAGIVMTAEGCYYGKCSFCVPSRGKCLKYHKFGIGEVSSALRKTRNGLGSDLVFFGDDSIDASFLTEILTDFGKGVFWQGEFRFEPRLSDEIIYRLKDKGCLQVLFGLESYSERVRNLMNKGIRQEDIERILRACKLNGINVNLQTIIGFPSETLEESYRTVRFLYDNRDSVASCAMNPFCLYQGSDVYNYPDKYGIEITCDDYICKYVSGAGIPDEWKEKLSKAYFSSLCAFYAANEFFIDGPMGNHAMIYYKHNVSL